VNKFETPSQCVTIEAQDSILKAAKDCNDRQLLAKVGGIDFIAKEIKYHNNCRKLYLDAAKRKCEESVTKPSDFHKKAFSVVKEHVDKVIVEEGGVMLTKLLQEYVAILSEHGVTDSDYTSQSLQMKICKVYKDKVKVEKITRNLGLVVFACTTDVHEAYAYAQEKTKVQFMVEEAARCLRSDVMHLLGTSSSLPYPLHAGDLAKGEAHPPESLRQFFNILYTGFIY
jgi:hypothetical protein